MPLMTSIGVILAIMNYEFWILSFELLRVAQFWVLSFWVLINQFIIQNWLIPNRLCRQFKIQNSKLPYLQLWTPIVARSAVSTLTMNWSTVLRVSLFFVSFMVFWLLKLMMRLRDAFEMCSGHKPFCLHCKGTIFVDANHTMRYELWVLSYAQSAFWIIQFWIIAVW